MAEDSTCPHCGRELTSPVALGQSHSKFGAAGHGLAPAAELGAIDEAGGPRRLLEDLIVGLELVPHVSLRDTEDRDNSAACCLTSAAVPAPHDRAARLRRFGEIAHGGMGTVLMPSRRLWPRRATRTSGCRCGEPMAKPAYRSEPEQIGGVRRIHGPRFAGGATDPMSSSRKSARDRIPSKLWSLFRTSTS